MVAKDLPVIACYRLRRRTEDPSNILAETEGENRREFLLDFDTNIYW